MAQKVLVVDDESNIRFVLAELMRREGFDPDEAADGAAAVEMVAAGDYDIVLLDLRMPRLDGMGALKRMRELRPGLIVVMITAHGSQQTAIEAVAAGAYDFFNKPFDVNEVRVVVRRAAEKAALRRTLERMEEEGAKSRYAYGGIVGQSAPMREVYALVQRVTKADVTVLVTGESGTGKEVVASAIHFNSNRAAKPFIKVNTAAIPENLLESELFGHERGSFTGAVSQKIGRFEAANGGTLFLDEIGDMPLALQSKLLRVLQEREIERVGATKTIPVDIRILCATHRDLPRMVAEGSFREDLLYRINVLPVHLPPLRDRREDIPLLLDHFISIHNPRLGKDIRGVDDAALQRFLAYPWPGNVRELENIVQRTMLLARGHTIALEDLPPAVRGGVDGPGAAGSAPPSAAALAGSPLEDVDFGQLFDFEEATTPLAERLAGVSDRLEAALIRRALAKCGGKRQETADLLGISRKSLHNKMVRYSLFGEDSSAE